MHSLPFHFDAKIACHIRLPYSFSLHFCPISGTLYFVLKLWNKLNQESHFTSLVDWSALQLKKTMCNFGDILSNLLLYNFWQRYFDTVVHSFRDTDAATRFRSKRNLTRVTNDDYLTFNGWIGIPHRNMKMKSRQADTSMRHTNENHLIWIAKLNAHTNTLRKHTNVVLQFIKMWLWKVGAFIWVFS